MPRGSHNSKNPAVFLNNIFTGTNNRLLLAGSLEIRAKQIETPILMRYCEGGLIHSESYGYIAAPARTTRGCKATRLIHSNSYCYIAATGLRQQIP